MPHPTRPLPDTHPEFQITHWDGFTEYRVEHWRLVRDGSGRIIRGATVWSWVDVGILCLLALATVLSTREAQGVRLAVTSGIALAYVFWACFTQVLHESLLVFPTLGIQLETHRGHPLLPLSCLTTRHFIPLSALEDVIIHEGLRRWNVRYYLAALQRRRARSSGSEVSSEGRIEVHVAFENILPYFPVLKHVYLGVHQTLFPPPTRVEDDDG